MRTNDAASAARTVIDDFDIADLDEEYDLHQALVSDDHFGAVSYLYQELAVYTRSDSATGADREARDALKRSIREHAQRVEGNLEDTEKDQ